jgi:phosphate/sulfate permease
MFESGTKSVNWGMFSKIAVSWLITVPAAGAVAAALLALTQPLVTV